MNYIKVFDVEESKAEETVNAWLKEIDALGHRVMGNRVHFYSLSIGVRCVKLLFTVQDTPHPNAKPRKV